MWVTRTLSIDKYKRVARGQDGMEVKSMISLVLVKKNMLHYVQDVRGMRYDLSDHHVIQCKVRLVGAWINRRGSQGTPQGYDIGQETGEVEMAEELLILNGATRMGPKDKRMQSTEESNPQVPT